MPESPASSVDPAQGSSAVGRLPLGRRRFIAGLAGAAAATALATTVHAAVPGGASYFEPITPVRLADTRTYEPYANILKNFTRLDDRTIRIKLDGRTDFVLPTGAVAAVVTVTALFNGSPGWVQVVPAGTTTEVSNTNLQNGDITVANLATVKIGPDSSIDVRGKFPYDVIVDIAGVYRSTATTVRAGRMEFLSAVRRAVATTPVTAGTTRTVALGDYVPATAQAVVVNLTAANATSRGFLTAYPIDLADRPNASNLNYGAGDTRAAGAIVRLAGGTPAIKVYSHGSTNLIVDVTGYMTGTGDADTDIGLFVPVDPYRVMDTRRAADAAASGKRRLWPGWTRPFVLPDGALFPRNQVGGVAMNVTLANAMRRGFVTVLPAQTSRFEVSNLNASRATQVVANHVIGRVSTRGVECYSSGGGEMICDIAGWYVGTPQTATKPSPPVDDPPPPANLNWLLTVPRMGLQNWVVGGPDGDPIVDVGNSWHWTNTGLIGAGNVSIVAFGHRTSHSGPYRNQHFLESGDQLVVDTLDQRQYRFQFIREQITNSSATNILDAARSNSGGSTFTLVACTGTRSDPSRLPGGGIAFRMVSTFQQTGWSDVSPTTG